MTESLVTTVYRVGHDDRPLPRLIDDAGDGAQRRFVEFFLVNIRNPLTRKSYLHAVTRFLAACDGHGVALHQITPIMVAGYIEATQQSLAPPTVKQHLAALRVFFDWMVVGQAIPFNPAASVRGPRYVSKRGKTPVLSSDELRQLFGSLETTTTIGLRDRAFLGVMLYSFARVGAVVHCTVGDYEDRGKRSWITLHEKGGKLHQVPLHHKADEYLTDYLAAAGIAGDKKSPLFRSVAGRSGRLTGDTLDARCALYMVKRRALAAGLSAKICNHSFRASGITNFRANGGSLEKAAAIAAHESTETTKLYDRSADPLTIDEIERIII